MDSFDLVWFHRADHAGLGRRVGACLIDSALILGLLFLIPWLLAKAISSPTQPQHKVNPLATIVIGSIMWAIVAIPYHIGLRRTRRGTLGYRLMDIRIINPHNATPDSGVIFKRLILSLLIPFVFFLLASSATISVHGRPAPHTQPAASIGQSVINLVALSVVVVLVFGNYWSVIRDPRRQALHDRFTGTWLVRSSALPAGPAVPVERAWILGPIVLSYWDVDPVPAATNPLEAEKSEVS